MGEPDWGRWQVILGVIGIVITLGGSVYGVIHNHPEDGANPIQLPDDTNKSPASDNKTQSSTGNISVASSPSGANVYLDDKYQGITPMILNNIEKGSHTVTLKLEGYEDLTKIASVDIGKQTSILEILSSKEKTPATGNVSVTSSPIGASIYLYDTYEGETPKILKDIEPGSYIITLKLVQYEDWSQTISVDPGKTFSLSPTLTFKPTSDDTKSDDTTSDDTIASTPSGEIENVWFENGVWDYDTGLKGVRIHTAFDTYNLKDEQCLIAAFFYNNLDDTQLRDNNGYYAVDGKVTVYDYFTPEYVNSSYSDFTLFIPYNELHMIPGTAYIRFTVVISEGDNVLDVSDWNDFSFVQY